MVVKLNVVWYSKTHERWRRLISHPGERSVSNSESCWVVRAAHPNNSSLHKEWGNLPFLLFHKALPHSWQATGFDGTDSLDLKGAISQVTPQSKQAHSSSSEIPSPYPEVLLKKLGDIRWTSHTGIVLWLDPGIYWINNKLGEYWISAAQRWRLQNSMCPWQGALSPTWGTLW